jgi:fatty-acyl-CoA synthase
MAGYFRDEAATAEAFRGGWFRTGDQGVVHPDGYVELRDRARDIIITSGENVSTIEVRQVLARHPAVLEVGVPVPRWGRCPRRAPARSGSSPSAPARGGARRATVTGCT